MILDFFECQSLVPVINVFSLSQQLALSVSCCTRLLPFYKSYSRQVNWGNPSLLGHIISIMWQTLGEDCVEIIEWRETYEKIKNSRDIYPSWQHDPENFEEEGYCSSYLYLQAQETVTCILCALEISLENTPLENTIGIIQHTRNAIEYYIANYDRNYMNTCEYKSTEEMMEILKSHPLIIQEMEKERSDIQLLQNSSYLSRSVLFSLRESSNDRGEYMLKMFNN